MILHKDIKKNFQKYRYRLILILICISGVLLYAFGDSLWNMTVSIYNSISDRETMKNFVESFGSAAPAVFILIQSLQVVFAPIPGEATGFIGGYLFGTIPGFLYSSIGLSIGSLLNFVLGGFLGERYVMRFIPDKYIDKFDSIAKPQGIIILFIFFVFPGFPKDLLCFFLGLTGSIPYKLFLILASIGRMPGTFFLSLQGAYYFEKLYWHFAIVLLICILVSIFAYKYRERVYEFIKNRNWD